MFSRSLYRNLACAILWFSLSSPALPQQGQGPDLVVDDFWESSQQIKCRVNNQGDAMCPGGYLAQLIVDGQAVDSVYLQSGIAPGKDITFTFGQFYWQCQQDGSHNLKVFVDIQQSIQETNENNNSREETWICDLTKPKILSGPTTRNITQTSATIDWSTNESSDSRVMYGTQPRYYPQSIRDALSSQNHSVLLDQLVSGTLYYYMVQSTDGSGNSVYSAEHSFTTETAKPDLPDLVVTRMWLEQRRLNCVVLNQGKGAAPKGFRATVSVDDLVYDTNAVPIVLAPGQSTQVTFPKFYFQCSEPAHVLSVTADASDSVEESSEANNSLIRKVDCSEPLRIISGPYVTKMSDSRATVTWKTNKPAHSRCRYDMLAELYGHDETDEALVTTHSLILSKLAPATTYQYRVTSTDDFGLSVASRSAYFSTMASMPGREPKFVFLDIQREPIAPLCYRISAGVDDPNDIAMVQFFMDDRLIHTDYAAPFDCPVAPGQVGLARGEFFAEHPIEVIATSHGRMSAGLPGILTPAYECNDISARFIDPFPGEVLYIPGDTAPAGTTVPITVYAAVFDWDCGFAGVPNERGEYVMMCEEDFVNVDEVRFFANTVPLGTLTSPSWGEVREHQYGIDWPVGGLRPGDYHLRVDAVTDGDCIQTVTRDFRIERGEPTLEVTRTVRRIGNVFEVELRLRNRGTVTFHCNRLIDNTEYLTPLSRVASDYEVSWSSTDIGRNCEVTIELGRDGHTEVDIAPGRTLTVSYEAIPVKMPIHLLTRYAIGHAALEVRGTPSLAIREFARACTVLEDGTPLVDAVDAAFAQSDYILMTNPRALLDEFGTKDSVLQTMAELAKYRNGILGYVFGSSSMDEDWVKDTVLREWGDNMTGSDGIADHYLSSGYLLLVGETEILPAWTVDISDRTYGDRTATHVYDSDAPYADMSGHDNSPELIVGRIIGDTADELIQAMQASMDSTFDRSYGIATSGSEADWENFVGLARDIYGVWQDQQDDGTMMVDGARSHHWSVYVHKEALINGYHFPVSASDGFLMANLTGSRVEAFKLSPSHMMRVAMHSTMDLSSTPFYHEYYCEYDLGDAIAAGDIDGDGEDEVLLGKMDEDQLVIGFDYSETHTRGTAFDVTLSPWDQLICADVVAGGAEEILVVRRTDGGTIDVYQYDNSATPTLTPVYTITSIPYTAWDGVAVGNVDTGNPGLEIVVANDSTDVIGVYTAMGTFLGQFPCEPYTHYDGMTVGNLDNDAGDEIAVIIDDTVDSKRRLKIFQSDCWVEDPNDGWVLRDRTGATVYSRFLQFGGIRTTGPDTRYDGFVAANLNDSDAKDELCLMHEDSERLYVLDGHYSGGWRDRYLPVLQTHDNDIDLFVMAGHGNVSSCSPFSIANINTLSFDQHPLVLALSCLTGGYEGKWRFVRDGLPEVDSRGDASFSNAFFKHGAAAYIGATEVSYSCPNTETGRRFFDAWAPGESAGLAFRNWERARISGDGWPLWVKEYNYYGDPKWGAMAASGTSSGIAALDAHTLEIMAEPEGSQITLETPDYHIEDINGVHSITLSDTGHHHEHGKSQVPYVLFEKVYPSNVFVQDVKLLDRQDLVIESGLNLPPANNHPVLEGVTFEPAVSRHAGWFPTKSHQWQVLNNGDSTCTLQVTYYPVQYNNITQEARIHRTFVLEIETIDSPVSIEDSGFTVQTAVPGEQLTGHMVLFNYGDPQDVIVTATIRHYGTSDLAAGLLLDTLNGLTGAATYSLDWNTIDHQAGDYTLDLKLASPSGQILAHKTHRVRLVANAELLEN